MRIELFFTPLPLTKESLINKTVVAIDVLRCSTSICQALSSGAKGVIPTSDSKTAFEIRSQLGQDNTLLAGERNGKKIENFQLGNSPLEFTNEKVIGKTIIMSTTNGTAIYPLAEKSTACFTGGLVNASAIGNKLGTIKKDIALVCAGREGHFSLEDTLCGGMLIDQLLSNKNIEVQLNDAAEAALILYREYKTDLTRKIRESEHARYLTSIGFGKDIDFATNLDSLPVVPVLHNGQLITESVLTNELGT